MSTVEVIAIIELIVIVVLIITFFVIASHISVIRKAVMRKYSYQYEEQEAAMAKMQGDNDAYLKHMFRAMYYYWVNSSYVHNKANHELLKNEMKLRYFDVITKAGAKFPEKYMPKA